jgi:hypothetical protein
MPTAAFFPPRTHTRAARLALCLGLAGACFGVTATAGAPLEIDRFSVEAGTFLLSTDTKVRVDGTAGQEGTEFDAERTLGYSDSTRLRVDAAWRFANRHSVTAMWFDNTRESTHVIDRQITVGDVTYPVNAEIRSKNSTSIFDLAYEYVFMQRESWELAGSFGLHTIKFAMDLQAQSAGGQAALSNEISTGAPLPLFGLRGTWQLTKQLQLNAHAQYFTLSINEYSGEVIDLRADATWMFTKNFGVGVGYNSFDFDVDIARPKFTGSLAWKYGGGLLFVRAAW